MSRQKTGAIRGYPIVEQQIQLKWGLIKVAVVADLEALIDQAEHEDLPTTGGAKFVFYNQQEKG